MITVIGSIDNASIWDTTYHLIFTKEEIYQFLVMDKKERFSDLYYSYMDNPLRMAPVEGEISSYKVNQDAVRNLVTENLERGKEIEANLESKLKEVPPKFTVIQCSSIDRVELTNGTPFSLPHLLMESKGEKIKFNLVHNNFKGRGKLQDEVFLSYENILREIFGDKLTVKN